MNKKRIDSIIETAINILNQDGGEMVKTLDNGKKAIEKKYFGYIASYGPTIRQATLLQAAKFYHQKEDREKINKLVMRVLHATGKITQEESSCPFDAIVISRRSDRAHWELWLRYINEAIAGCKMAMSAFEKIEDK